MKALTHRLVALPLLAMALGAGAPAYADTIVAGSVGQTVGTTGTNLYNTGLLAGSAGSDNLPGWSFTCTTCVGYGITANGAATVNNGTLRARSSLTVTGTPGSFFRAIADSGAVYTDLLTITGGTGSGVLALTYGLDGSISSTGTGLNGSSLTFYSLANDFQYNNGGIESGSYVNDFDNAAYSDTVTFYYAFTYGTAFQIEAYLDAESDFLAIDSTPYTASVDFYNTAALTSALVFGGTPSNPGDGNGAAQIAAGSGLVYGPNGIVVASGVPEPVTLSIFGAGLVGAAAMRRRRVKRA